jgi:hypothetical protein
MKDVIVEKVVADYLEHFGKMGMHWGQRKSSDGSTRSERKTARKAEDAKRMAEDDQKTIELFKNAPKVTVKNPIKSYKARLAYLNPKTSDSTPKPTRKEVKAAKKLAKADKKWEKNIYTLKGAIDIHNQVAETINPQLGALSLKHKNANLIDSPDSPASKKYVKEYEDLVVRETAKAVRSVHGTSPSGTKKATLDTSGDDWKIVITDSAVAHAADETNPDLIFTLQHDDVGFITSMDDAMAQSEDFVSEYLAHFGVSGMHWGQRAAKAYGKVFVKNTKKEMEQVKSNVFALKDPKQLGKTLYKEGRTNLKTNVNKLKDPKQLGKDLYNEGKTNLKSNIATIKDPKKAIEKVLDMQSEDHTKSREMQKRGTKNLSTKELKEVTTRLQLEKQYSTLNPNKINKGLAIVTAITAAGTTVASAYALSRTPLGKDITRVVTKGFKKSPQLALF